MKRTSLFALIVLALALPGLLAAETWKSVTLVDSMCAQKVKADPDKHTKTCALKCSGSGMGILTSDGDFLKFDEAGNKKAIAALKASKKADHLRATVTGEKEGDTLKVESLKLD